MRDPVARTLPVMRIRIVDAFTDRPYAGNPAAVLLLETAGFPEDERLQRVASEMNLSETAFAHPLADDAGADWALRWFTPACEVDMCGHATLATAHVLLTSGLAKDSVRFRTRSGVLTAEGEGDEITLGFPTATLTAVPVPEGLPGDLGCEVVAVHDTGPDVGDLLVELPDEEAVRNLVPDMTALTALARRGVIVTAVAEQAGAGYDYVSRFFGPAVGIPEDPVTGSAHTALAPLWSERLGSDALTGLQVSARSGMVRTTLRGDRTELTGTAVTVLDGELLAGL